MKTQELIQELKEEIDRVSFTLKRVKSAPKDSVIIFDEPKLCHLQDKLQFAEKLIKAIKDDVEKIGYEEGFDVTSPEESIVYEDGYSNGFEEFKEKLNKILDESLR